LNRRILQITEGKKRGILKMLKTKPIWVFLLISSSFILIAGLFFYLQPSYTEAESTEGCFAPPAPEFAQTGAGAWAVRGGNYKTPILDPALYQWSYCYLSEIGFENIDSESASCEAYLTTDYDDPDDEHSDGTVMWTVKAALSESDYNSARCSAHCIYLGK